MEFPTSGRQWRDSDVIGAKENMCIKICYFFLLGRVAAALLLNVMTFWFFCAGFYVRHVIQMMFINIATGIKFVVQIQVKKTHPIYYMYIGPVYMYSDWATAAERGEIPDFGKARGKPAESS
jgi:hypothetical protein